MRLLCNPTSGINQVRGTQLRVTGRWRTNWGSGPPPSMRQSGTVAGQMSTPLGFSQPLTRRRLMSCCCRICLGIWGTSHRSRRACRPRRCRMSGDDGHVSLACLFQLEYRDKRGLLRWLSARQHQPLAFSVWYHSASLAGIVTGVASAACRAAVAATLGRFHGSVVLVGNVARRV